MTCSTETESLIQALKLEFKRLNMTYKQIAEQMNLSETSIKRLFSNKNISLPRLESLCQIAHLDFAGLVKLAEQSRSYSDQLSLQQEQEIVSDIRLILVMVCLINHWQFNEILEKYAFKETELIRLFVKLDKLKVIDLLPNNHYKLNLSRNFSWQTSGPIQKFFLNAVMQKFLQPTPSEQGHHLKYIWGMLTPNSAAELNKRIQKLIEEFLTMAEYDKRTSVHDKMTSSLMVLFRENWEPDEFKKLQLDGYKNPLK